MNRLDFIKLCALGLIGCDDEEIQPVKASKIFYSFIGTTSSFNPGSLNPVLWADFQNGTFANSTDNNGTRAKGNLVDSFTAETGQTLSNAGTLASKGIYNGEGIYMELGAQFTVGDASTFNFLHDGTDFDVFFVYKQITASAGNTRALLLNNGFSNTAKGILFYYDNTSSLNKLKLRIGNGTQTVISIDTSNNSITQNADNKIRINKNGNTVTIYVNGVSVGSHTATNSFGSGNAVGTMSIASTTAATVGCYLKDVWIKNAQVTGDDLTNMNARTFTSVTPTAINVDVLIGDSNCEGRATNASIDPSLTGTHNTLIYKMANATVLASDYIERLQLAVNQKFLNQTLTQHSIEMKMGYLFANSAFTRAIFKFGQGSTDSNEWTVGGSTYTKILTGITRYCLEMLHAHRRTVTVRSIIMLHGANDCQSGEGGNYKSNMTTGIKGIIDQFVTEGATVKARIVCFRTRSGGTGFDATAYAAVVAAQTDFGNGSIPTDEPSIAAYVLGSVSYSTEAYSTIDTVHYNSAAYDGMGQSAYDYLSPFSNE